MTWHAAELVLSLNTEPEDDAEEMAELSKRLREELLELDVQDIAFVGVGEIPAKAKAGDPITWGTLLVTLAASGGVLTTLVGVLQSWLSRQERHSLTIEIDGDKLELMGISSEEQKELIDAWLMRHRRALYSDE